MTSNGVVAVILRCFFVPIPFSSIAIPVLILVPELHRVRFRAMGFPWKNWKREFPFSVQTCTCIWKASIKFSFKLLSLVYMSPATKDGELDDAAMRPSVCMSHAAGLKSCVVGNMVTVEHQ